MTSALSREAAVFAKNDYTFSPQRKTLAVLRPGEAAIIAGYHDGLADERRLLEMGLIVGTPVRMVKAAPLGDPLQLRVRGFHLTLSKKAAQAIIVKTHSTI